MCNQTNEDLKIRSHFSSWSLLMTLIFNFNKNMLLRVSIIKMIVQKYFPINLHFVISSHDKDRNIENFRL